MNPGYRIVIKDSNALAHHGIIGQKWGIRRYQNLDGSLTAEGKKRYGRDGSSELANTANASSAGIPEDIKKDLYIVNGGKNGMNKSFLRSNNCALCTATYEMRRRGYDVQSQEAVDGVYTEVSQSLYPNLKKKDIHEVAKRTGDVSRDVGMIPQEFDDMVKNIVSESDNSRGSMRVTWAGDHGAHIFNYEVIDKQFYLVDTQPGECLSGKDAYKYLSHGMDVKYWRTDNQKMDTKLANKYFCQPNTGDVKDEKTNTSVKIGTALQVAGLGAFTPAFIGGTAVGGPVGAMIGWVGSAALTTIGAGIRGVGNEKIEKLKQQRIVDLENKWQQENRFDFYQGKTLKAKNNKTKG